MHPRGYRHAYTYGCRMSNWLQEVSKRDWWVILTRGRGMPRYCHMKLLSNFPRYVNVGVYRSRLQSSCGRCFSSTITTDECKSTLVRVDALRISLLMTLLVQQALEALCHLLWKIAKYVSQLVNISPTTTSQVEGQLRQKDDMGDALHYIDFHQLQIENKQYVSRIEERNEELLKARQEIVKRQAHFSSIYGCNQR